MLCGFVVCWVIAGASKGREEGNPADSRADVGNHSRAAGCVFVLAECLSHTQVLEASVADILPPIRLLSVRHIKRKRQVRKMTSAERDKVWAVRHEWGGEKVHSLVLDMCGFSVKSPQILATKADFIPEPSIRRLSNHLDNAPLRPFAEVQRSIMQQLATCPRSNTLSLCGGGLVPLGEVFLEVDSTALAAASIAHVHIFSSNTWRLAYQV